jgi:hypothetical protein
MADKKVERSRNRRPLTPSHKLHSALSDPGTMNMAEPGHDKGKSALVDRFRQREERWRREQSLHNQLAAQEAGAAGHQAPEPEGPDGAAGEQAPTEGGAQ